jgi:hypothetical protein
VPIEFNALFRVETLKARFARFAHPLLQQLAAICAHSLLLLLLLLALPLTCRPCRAPATVDLSTDRADHFSLTCE